MARLDRKVRKRVLVDFPPEKCHAIAKSTRKRCTRWQMVGATICPTHGAMAKQVRDKAMQRIALAEARLDVRALEPRPPGEVMTEALHISDMAMRNALVGISYPPTEEQFNALMTQTSRAHHMAKVNHEAGLAEAHYRLQARQASEISDLFSRVLRRINLTPAQLAQVPEALNAELGPVINGQAIEIKGNGAKGKRKSLSTSAYIPTP